MILKQLVRFLTKGATTNGNVPCCYHHTTDIEFPLVNYSTSFSKDYWGNYSGTLGDYMSSISLSEPINTWSSNTSATNRYHFLCLVGGGTTPATVDDRQLENLYTTDQLTQNTQSLQYLNMKMNVTTTYTNKTDSNLTINEIGLGMYNKHMYTANTTGTCGAALLTREVLSTPIVLAPGESRTFALTIDFLDMLTQ